MYKIGIQVADKTIVGMIVTLRPPQLACRFALLTSFSLFSLDYSNEFGLDRTGAAE
jgi:hypothetical protein